MHDDYTTPIEPDDYNPQKPSHQPFQLMDLNVICPDLYLKKHIHLYNAKTEVNQLVSDWNT